MAETASRVRQRVSDGGGDNTAGFPGLSQFGKELLMLGCPNRYVNFSACLNGKTWA